MQFVDQLDKAYNVKVTHKFITFTKLILSFSIHSYSSIQPNRLAPLTDIPRYFFSANHNVKATYTDNNEIYCSLNCSKSMVFSKRDPIRAQFENPVWYSPIVGIRTKGNWSSVRCPVGWTIPLFNLRGFYSKICTVRYFRRFLKE